MNTPPEHGRLHAVFMAVLYPVAAVLWFFLFDYVVQWVVGSQPVSGAFQIPKIMGFLLLALTPVYFALTAGARRSAREPELHRPVASQPVQPAQTPQPVQPSPPAPKITGQFASRTIVPAPVEGEIPHRSLFETAGDAIMLIQGDRFIDCNARTLQVFQCQRDFIVGHRPYEVSPLTQPDGRYSVESATEKIVAAMGGAPQFFEWEHLRCDGTSFIAEVSLNSVSVGGEGLVQAIVRDVSERKHSEHSINRLNRFFALLYSVNETIIRAADRLELYEKICRACVERGQLKAAAVVVFDCENDRIAAVSHFGSDDDFIELLGVQSDEPGKHCLDIQEAMTGRQYLVINDIEHDELYLERMRQPSLDRGYRALALVPLRFNNQTIATLNIYSGEPLYFEDDELVLLAQMGDDISFALEMIDQAAELKNSYERMRVMFEQTTRALASAFEKRDPYTAGHQQRVSDLAVAIAVNMGLAQASVDCVRVAGMLHDIGKIGVPAETLTKPGMLSDMEIGLIRTHVEVGYQILKDLDFPWPVATVVRQHHEKINGSGYPLGLGGDAILLESKIVCVADVVETMASYRPYRAPLGIDAALAQIVENSGIFYDPVVVDACLHVFKEGSFTFDPAG